MTATAMAMPARKRGQKLAFSFDEDEVTLAAEAVRSAGLGPGAKVAAHGFEKPLPEWFWKGTCLVPDPAAATHLRAIPTTLGPSVAVHAAGVLPGVEAEAVRVHAAAPQRPEPEWQRHRLARDAPDTEADFPLGAHVVPGRHNEVLSERMLFLGGKVLTWTRIEPGAAPTEFLRLQEAVGAYHVVLVEAKDGTRTVGIWAGDAPPATGQAVRPVLRRLCRQQGEWRHGVKFAPDGG